MASDFRQLMYIYVLSLSPFELFLLSFLNDYETHHLGNFTLPDPLFLKEKLQFVYSHQLVFFKTNAPTIMVLHQMDIFKHEYQVPSLWLNSTKYDNFAPYAIKYPSTSLKTYGDPASEQLVLAQAFLLSC